MQKIYILGQDLASALSQQHNRLFIVKPLMKKQNRYLWIFAVIGIAALSIHLITILP